MSSFYIATRLEQAAYHNEIRDRLIKMGHQITYDWTLHGSVKKEGSTRLQEVGENMINAIINADATIVLLPGGKGTHTEMGAAIAADKKVILCNHDAELFSASEGTSAFYFHKNVIQVLLEDPTDYDKTAKMIHAFLN